MNKEYKNIEKAWLICVALFFFLYNLPGVPLYGNGKTAIIHGVITVGLLWVACYAGLFAIYKFHPPLETPKKDDEVTPYNEERGAE